MYDGVGFIHTLSKQIWDGHPCCAFAASKEFISRNPNTYRALLRAIMEATAFAAKLENRKQIAEAIAPANYLNQTATVVEQVLTGTYADGLGNVRKEPHRIDFDPFIQVLKPISPLAWMPLALFTLKDSAVSAIFVIFICSIWPMLINTAFGVAAVRREWLNVARTLEVGPLRKAFRVILPAAAPTIMTGMRISIGIAWLVIVAAEMLVGGTGIGYFVWRGEGRRARAALHRPGEPHRIGAQAAGRALGRHEAARGHRARCP